VRGTQAQPQAQPSGRSWALTALGLAAGIGAIAVANRLIAMSAGELYSVLEGEEGRYAWEHGDIFYTVRGRGAPLLLVHGIYAGASSFEYRRVFEPLSHEFRVYALDLLGFGLSARPPVVYTPQLYIRLIEDFTRQVMGGADHPVSVVASSLSAAFTIHAAADRPSLFERLVLIEPTGLEVLNAPRVTPERQVARGVLRSPVVGEGLYNLVASRPSIRYYLGHQAYADAAAVTDELVDYYYLTAHQAGARYAPASFISGTLDTPVGGVYPELRQPILLAWGKDARIAPLGQARAFREANAGTELRVFDSGARPQDEMPEEFAREVALWLRAGSGSRRAR
jgi:pimeloyl-ACP methyl ester carboxylesterase